jgi:hypothetical protein
VSSLDAPQRGTQVSDTLNLEKLSIGNFSSAVDINRAGH